MSKPNYPPEINSLNRNQIVNDLLESIALEELAIAHLINAEAEKIQAFTGSDGEFPTSPTNKQIVEFQRYLARMLEALTEKQKLLTRTMEMVRDLFDVEQIQSDKIEEMEDDDTD